MSTLSNELTPQQMFSQKLREVADFYDRHPGVKTPSLSEISIFGADKDEISAGAKAFGSARKEYGDNHFSLVKTFPSGMRLEFFTTRDTVCTRKVVGFRDVPEQLIPAKREEVVEWECLDSLLAPNAPQTPSEGGYDDIF